VGRDLGGLFRWLLTLGSKQPGSGAAPLSVGSAILLCMAYDEDLADRVRSALTDQPGLTEKKMFGGLAFLVHGNMAVAASGQGGLLLHIDAADADALTKEPHVRRMEMRGREMDGWLRIDAEAVDDDTVLRRWVTIGATYAGSLPAK
jgi:TfoX/Sxy family transcriptional regulator of competence genes